MFLIKLSMGMFILLNIVMFFCVLVKVKFWGVVMIIVLLVGIFWFMVNWILFVLGGILMIR